MKTTAIVVTVHLLLMSIYIVFMGRMNESMFIQSLFILPCHVAICLFVSIVCYTADTMSPIEKSKWMVYSKAHLLAAIVIAIVGPVMCTTVIP